jgi:predicted amidohydrolase YtcJ
MRLLIENCKVFGEEIRSIFVDGRVIARTSESPEQTAPPDTICLDGDGATLLGGMVDSHCHPFEYGWLKRNIDLRGTNSVTGLRLRLSSRLQRTEPGKWATGMGWDHEAFPGRKMPTRTDIDDISPRNPVALKRVDGHVALLNSNAIKSLGLEAKTGDEYERGADGRLTGVVKERALADVFSAIPRTADECSADLMNVEFEAIRLGLTKLHCIISEEGFKEELEALASLHGSGSLSLRYRVYLPPNALAAAADPGLKEKLMDDSVRINGVKIYADGSLGARTAALRQPYSDDPGNTGKLRYSDQQLSDLVERVDAAGFQVIIHAIGDRAIEQAIGALSLVSGTKNPRRHRIEHASLLPRDLRSRMSKHGIRASVQPCFITSDTWAVDRLGEERAADLYPLRSMFEAGIVASGGSDSPVETLSPVIGAWAASVRAGVADDETLTLDRSLKLYTDNADSNGFDDHSGIREGAPADLTLLDSNVEGMHPALFRKVGVTAVVIGGELVNSSAGGRA